MLRIPLSLLLQLFTLYSTRDNGLFISSEDICSAQNTGSHKKSYSDRFRIIFWIDLSLSIHLCVYLYICIFVFSPQAPISSIFKLVQIYFDWRRVLSPDRILSQTIYEKLINLYMARLFFHKKINPPILYDYTSSGFGIPFIYELPCMHLVG